MRGCRCVTRWVRPGTWRTRPCFSRPMRRISLPASRSRSMAAPWSTSTERPRRQGQRAYRRAQPQRSIALIDLTLMRIACARAPRPCRAPRACRRRCPTALAPAAVGAGDDAFLREVFRRFADDRGHLVGGFHLLARHIDRANLHVLAVDKLQQADRNTGISALDRNLSDPALGKRRKNLLVLAPFVAERCLPVDVGLDAVAVANVNGGGAGQALD